jgi:moderate conductance mechanosensitive channel
VFPHAHLMGLDLAQAPVTLTGSCGRDPGIACRLVWDVSHSGTAARLTAVYLAGPANLVLKLAWLVFLALVARALVHRLINRVTIRAADSPLHTRLRQSTGVRVRRKLWGRRRQRERAVTETALAEADHALTGTASSTGASALPDTAAVHEAASERRHQRAHALGSILRNASSVTIFAIATAIGLGDLGVNLAPVLASAGVVGIAVGFGAQNLVRDFLAGIFMLLEDQYGVGDVINIGDATGTVEAVSLRTTRLRDVNGVVWHLRNGALEKVGNESQGWARAVVDVPVPPGLDIADTRQVMEQEAGAMWRERRWRKLMLEKPEVWGVQDISITDSQVVMRVAAKTLPLRQWEVARELRERVKSALDAGRPAPLEAGPGRAHPARKTPRATASRKAATVEAGEGATVNADNGAAVEAEEDVAVEAAAQGAAVAADEDVAERGPRSAP